MYKNAINGQNTFVFSQHKYDKNFSLKQLTNVVWKWTHFWNF